jgi:uncharacterized membrane protein
MSEVHVSIDIDAPVQEVFDLAMDMERTTEWVTIVRGVGPYDEGPLRVGYEMEQKLCLRGVTFKVQWRLAELDAPHRVRWEGKGPAGSKAVVENRLHQNGAGTRFDYVNEFKAPFGALGAVASRALVGGVPEHEANASLLQLKALAERR